MSVISKLELHHRVQRSRPTARLLLAASASLASLMAFAPSAMAQTAAGASDGPTIEEVVVTAEKREQSLQQVSVAVSAFTSEKRDVLGVTTV